MKSVNTFPSLGSAAHAGKRAAAILFVLQNKQKQDYNTVIESINETLTRYGEQSPDVSFADLDDFKAVARQLLAFFEAPDLKSAALVANHLLAEYAYRPRLSSHDDSPWHLHVDNDDDAPWAAWFAASSTLALAILLADKQRNPAGLCAARGCGRPFIDLGKGGGRIYCSPKCATRERVAAYRKNHA